MWHGVQNISHNLWPESVAGAYIRPLLALRPGHKHTYICIYFFSKRTRKKERKYVERLPFELKKRDEARDNIIYNMYIHNAYYKMKQECGVMYVVNKM